MIYSCLKKLRGNFSIFTMQMIQNHLSLKTHIWKNTVSKVVASSFYERQAGWFWSCGVGLMELSLFVFQLSFLSHQALPTPLTALLCCLCIDTQIIADMCQKSHSYLCCFDLCRRLVPYGMSSYRGPQRIRREVANAAKDKEAESWRCACARPADPECQRFCQSRSV